MFRPIRIIVLFSILFLFRVHCFAQSQGKTGTIHLKNGWTMTGRYTPLPGGGVEIQTGDGNRWSFPAKDIDSISERPSHGRQAGWYRFGHYTEIGALAATKNRPDNVTTAAFSFQVVNGYRFRPGWFLGLGTGLDLYATQTILPVFATLRVDLLPHRELTPYVFVDGGQGFDITTGNSTVTYRGGALFAAGAGLKIHVSKRTSFHVQAGFRLQKGSTIENGVERNYDNQRMALRAGFTL